MKFIKVFIYLNHLINKYFINYNKPIKNNLIKKIKRFRNEKNKLYNVYLLNLILLYQI